jgi:hypothetical protein
VTGNCRSSAVAARTGARAADRLEGRAVEDAGADRRVISTLLGKQVGALAARDRAHEGDATCRAYARSR